MKSITVNLPKFLMVNDEPEKNITNKHLLKPFVEGELVKVHENQEPETKTTPEVFKRNYVRVIRKDKEGAWTLVYVESWSSFKLLKAKV